MGRYLLAAFAGRLADSMWLAPVLLVLDRTGSAGQAGLVLSAATLPTILTAPLVGGWLDAHGRRRAALTVHFVVLASALSAMVAGAPAVAYVLIAGLLQPLVTGGFSSMLPALARSGYPRAAALDSMTYNVASIAGPALAGLVAAVVAPAAAVLVQAALALVGVPLVLALPVQADGVPARGGVWRAGVAYLVRRGPLRAVTLVSSLSQVGWGAMNVMAPALAVALGASHAQGGLILAAVAAGGLLGAPLLPRLHGRNPLVLVAGGTLAHGAGLAALALAPSLPVALAAAAVAGAPQGLATAAMFTARARWAPARLHAQVFTSAAGVRTGLYAVGAALAGPVLAAGARPAAVIAAAWVALSAVAATG